MSQQFHEPQWLIFVRFEQGRGASGVPKAWLSYSAGHPKNPDAKPEIATIVREAVAVFRAMCADPNIGHGRDLMPGSDDEYQLHNVDGARIEEVDDIRWETIEVQDHKEKRAELVLTWKSPVELLMITVSA